MFKIHEKPQNDQFLGYTTVNCAARTSQIIQCWKNNMVGIKPDDSIKKIIGYLDPRAFTDPKNWPKMTKNLTFY